MSANEGGGGGGDIPPEHESTPILLLAPRSSGAPRPTPRAMRAARMRVSAAPRSGAAAPPMAGVDWVNPAAVTRKLGAAGLLVSALLVLLSIFADIIASEFPIACKVHGTVFVLPCVTRPAELAGVDLKKTAEWSVGPIVAQGVSVVSEPLLGPSSTHPLGTDRAGRDVFSRTIHGTRSYLVFALGAVLASLTLGAMLGGIAGLFGGAADVLVSRVVESVSAFPPLVLVLGIQAALPKPTLFTLFLAIALTRWPEVARLVRGEVLLATTQDYVLAARALGASPMRILRRHIVPNVRASLVVAASLGVSAVVLTEASLDFLRVGTPPGAPSWGETMSQFRDAPSAWWLLAFPGVLLVVTVVSYNLMGEALRDRLDPRGS